MTLYTYTGEWKDGEPHGQGSATYAKRPAVLQHSEHRLVAGVRVKCHGSHSIAATARARNGAVSALRLIN